jgi:large subunit ribosomal protein L5
MNPPFRYQRRIELAEKKPTGSAKKKAVPKKVTKKPDVKTKVVTVEKVAKTVVSDVVKKPAKKKKAVSNSIKTDVIPIGLKVEIEKKTVAPDVSEKEKVVSQAPVIEPKGTLIKDKKAFEAEEVSVKKLMPKEKVGLKVTKQRDLIINPMLIPRIEKVTVNMSVGKSGTPLQQAVTILKQLTDQEPSKRAAKKTIREFGIRKGESIACLVTIRNERAEQFLNKAFSAIDNKLSRHNFDRQGNFSFGIKEHIDIPGTKYSPELGIHGMDISVSLGRPGYRVKRRHRVKSKIGKNHLLTTDEAILFIKDEFDVEIT